MIHTLTNNPLFRGITPEKLSANLEEVSFHARSYKKGEILVRQGDVCNRLIILIKGSVRGEMIDLLTAGCAKYRYNKLALGDINGIPRVLDAGQCNDSYSLAVIALKLKEIFGLDDVNKLPIVYNIAWYEQKAVIVLLALLALGVKNIHLGPTLPAFLSPNIKNVLIEQFGIGGISTVDEDIMKFLS